jgi:hypothetical protein
VTSAQRRRNQARQLAHLRRIAPATGAQVAAEVNELDNLDERQTVISQGIFTAAAKQPGWWDWMPNVIKVEFDDIALHDPHQARRLKYGEHKLLGY